MNDDPETHVTYCNPAVQRYRTGAQRGAWQCCMQHEVSRVAHIQEPKLIRKDLLAKRGDGEEYTACNTSV